MVKITKDKHIYSMCAKNPAAAEANSGDIVLFETLDAFGGQIRSGDTLFSDIGWDRVNPATGPLYIRGAEPGDCLKVTIVDIAVRGKASMVLSPNFGVVDVDAEKSFVFDTEGSELIFDAKTRLPMKPMIGVIGTAPKDGSIPTGTPGDHGGNIDTARIVKGAVLYLPVNAPGALLALGDLHALMGDGEVCVCGAEAAGDVTVKVEVLKEFSAPLPFLEEGEHVIAIASKETLDAAAKQAALNMQAYLVNKGMSKEKAALLLSLAGNLRISQVVDPLMTARMEFPLALIYTVLI